MTPKEAPESAHEPGRAHGSGNAGAAGPGDAPPKASRRRGLRYAWMAIVFALLVGVGSFTWLVVAYPAQRGPGSGRVREVPLGAAADLDLLRLRVGEYELVRRPRLFALYAWVMGAGGRVRSGAVLVRDDMTPRELLQRFATGFGPTELRITFPEGLTRFAVAERLARWGVCTAEAFIAASEDRALLAQLHVSADSAEGYLFPDTYRIRDDTGARALVRRFVQMGKKRLDSVFEEETEALSALRAELGFGPHEVLTLASIVEEEAAVPEEQALIAGVFLNRLRDPDFKPKRLQADPTVAYGCRVQPDLSTCAGFDGRRVTRRMTADPDNRYNTYRHEGLPPGPIANPGVAAVRAVLRPAEHRYFYFVARGAGRHRFSETLDQHNDAVDLWRGQ